MSYGAYRGVSFIFDQYQATCYRELLPGKQGCRMSNAPMKSDKWR